MGSSTAGISLMRSSPPAVRTTFRFLRNALSKILHIAGSFLLIGMNDLFDVNKKQPCFRSDVDTEEKNEGSVQRVRQLCEQSLDSSKLHPCNAKSD